MKCGKSLFGDVFGSKKQPSILTAGFRVAKQKQGDLRTSRRRGQKVWCVHPRRANGEAAVAHQVFDVWSPWRLRLYRPPGPFRLHPSVKAAGVACLNSKDVANLFLNSYATLLSDKAESW